MPIESAPYYFAKCDNCGERANYDEFTAYDDPGLAADEAVAVDWTEIAIGQANTFTDIEEGRALYLEAAQAHKRGHCNRRQQDLIQNTVTKRVKKLQAVTVVAEAEDLGRQAAEAHAAAETPADEGGDDD